MSSPPAILSRLGRGSSDASRSGCTLCGYPGHFRYQCRNFQQLNPNLEVALDVSSTSSDSEIDMMTIAIPGSLQIDSRSNSVTDDRRNEGSHSVPRVRSKSRDEKKKKHKSRRHRHSSSSSESDDEEGHRSRRRHRHHKKHKKDKSVHKKYKKSRSRSRSRSKSRENVRDRDDVDARDKHEERSSHHRHHRHHHRHHHRRDHHRE